ncbi:ferritin-like domain-containing protein [Conexibacter stalactiti]|uniref:Ferritin-like domain-containing protein n=1 Tax=Conexibacter stalactiti TaxID=1940611 RepID=A0ABU4HLH4_9ACTN|nr:ferritin-like domain-containing protein [Conexibacter stalactiti]MDW5594151.1 ferritin-like domain-containing protein [Conexibacter stalactiti]MEC5034793.1 ferritin-like domain-containing protein [Conexibacter stalactiti]
MVARPSRRTFLRGAAAGLATLPAVTSAVAGGTLLGGCGGDEVEPVEDFSTTPGRIPPGVSGDAELLGGALAAEYRQVAAYLSGLPLLEAQALADAECFLAHERAHVARLRELIGGLGGPAVGPRPSYDFGLPGTSADVLRTLERVEQETIAVYLQIVPRLTDPLLRATAASIAVVEAEHQAVVRQRLGRQPLPTAFVTGGR